MSVEGAKPTKVLIWDSTNKTWKKWDGVLTTGDIEIGAVEIKDHDGTDRATVTSSHELKVIDSSITTVLGEVQASPTSNTVLDRLKSINTAQLADGHNVTVDNAAGSGVYVQPGTSTTWTVDLGINNDVSLNTGANVIGKVKLVDSGGTEITETTDHSMNVTIVADDAGIGGGFQYAEDAGHSSGDKGTMALVVRDDALAANAGTSADLDYMPMRGDNYGALWVTLTDASGSGVDASAIGGGTQYTLGTDAYTEATSIGTLAGAVRNDTLATLVDTDNEIAPLQVNASGALYIDVADGGVLEGHVDGIETVLGTIDTDTSNMATSLGNIDNAVDGNFLNVNCNIAGTDFVGGAGAVAAGVQRVTLASDDPAVVAVQLIDDTVYTDDTSTHSTGTSKGIGIMAAATPTDGSVAANDIGMVAMSVDRRLHVDAQIVGADAALDVSAATVTVDATDLDIRDLTNASDSILIYGSDDGGTTKRVIETDSGGAVAIQDGGNTITVDGAVNATLQASDGTDIGNVDVASVVPGTGATNLGKAEDAAHSSGDVGVMALGVENEDQADLSTGDKDYTPIAVTKEGNVVVKQEGAIDASGATVTVDLGANNDVTATGNVAHDAGDSGNPIKIGGRAQEPTADLEEATADTDRVDAAFDRQGRIATWMGYPVLSADINDSTSGDNTIVAAAGAGVRIAVLGCVIVSDGTVDVRWEDGAGGTAKTGQIPLQEREGFVMPIGPQPWFVGTANTLLNLELSAAVNCHGIVSYVEMTD